MNYKINILVLINHIQINIETQLLNNTNHGNKHYNEIIKNINKINDENIRNNFKDI